MYSKRVLLFFAPIMLLALVLSGCGLNDRTGVITEENAPDSLDSYDSGDVVARIDEINNGATPQVKPNKKSNPETMPQPPQSEQKQVQLEDLAATYKSAVIKTSLGDIKVEFYPDESPLTVNNFMNLAKDGFYDGTRFHRIISDFMIQGGDPLSKDLNQRARWGTGGPGYKFQDEFNAHKLVRGSLAMANSGPNTNGSQFFIVTKEATPWLDGAHTNFGVVVEGMDVVEKIEAAEVNDSDQPVEDVIVNGIELVN